MSSPSGPPEFKYPADLFDPLPLVTSVRGRRDSTPKADTVSRVRLAMDLVRDGMPVTESCGIAGISLTTYKDTKNWLKQTMR